ncbi:hypothetical protein [Candidatus Similichlamydia epinepheli]|uniref:hypothetical protein n=1 Tax=Candidatus Similichlamydia epinepheli TaxID=1903953 RepID=UPI001300460F|nr:hypothetical protein [Candidatus Similichlamydia epinepheli]
MVCFQASKWLLVGSRAERESFLKSVQLLGIVQFEDKGSTNLHTWDKYQLIVRALSFCEECKDQFCEIYLPKEEKEIVDRASELATKIVFLEEKKHNFEQKKEILTQERESLAPFGFFSQFQVRQLSKDLSAEISFLSLPLQEFNLRSKDWRLFEASRNGSTWYGILFGEETSLKEYVITIERDLYQVTSDLERLNEDIAELNIELKQKQNGKPYLEVARKLLLNQFRRTQAENATLDEESAFLAFIWVDPSCEEDLIRLTKEHLIYLERSFVEEGEVAPTVFRNEGYARIGQDLVEVYDVPSKTDQDPSFSVLVAFAIFFGLIMADMGYGLVILFASLYFQWKMPSCSGSNCRMVDLGKILGLVTSVWGGLIGSFFGVSFHSGLSPFIFLAEKKAFYHQMMGDIVWGKWILDYPQLVQHIEVGNSPLTLEVVSGGVLSTPIQRILIDTVIKEFVLIVGVCHLLFSMWRGRSKTRTHFGWSFCMLGGYFILADFLDATLLPHYIFFFSKEKLLLVANWVTFFGFLTAHFFAIQERGFLSGILEWMNAIQIFSDVLSYLRLYALGLSGAIIAETFNSISLFLPWPFSWGCLLFGHLINFGLGVMGAVVHSLRLNFLECYRYSFDGGGRPFRPLSIEK